MNMLMYLQICNVVEAPGVTEIIKIVVWGTFIVGMLCWVLARKSINEEQAAQNWVEEKLTNEVLTTQLLKSLILEREDKSEIPNLEQSLVYSRLNEIYRVLHRDHEESDGESEKRVTPPQLQDLHRMTLQEMQSRKAPTCLRITASVLLIIGICGTLWGVHACIGNHQGASSQLAALGTALEPSKYAVAFTVLLYVLQSYYLMRLERFICYLDRLTMTKFLPDLQPASGFAQTMNKVAEQVKHFGALVSSFDAIQDAVKEMQGTASKFTQIAEGYDKRAMYIKDQMDKINNIGEGMEKNYEALTAQIQLTEESVRKVSAELASAIRSEEDVKDSADKFAALLVQLCIQVDTVSSTASQITENMETLSKLESSVAALTPMKNTVATLSENCVNLQQQLAATADDTRQMEADLISGVNALSQSFDSLHAEVSRTSEDIRFMSANAQEFKEYADTMKQDMKNVVSSGKDAIKEYEENSTRIFDQLDKLKTQTKQLAESVHGKKLRS